MSEWFWICRNFSIFFQINFQWFFFYISRVLLSIVNGSRKLNEDRFQSQTQFNASMDTFHFHRNFICHLKIIWVYAKKLENAKAKQSVKVVLIEKLLLERINNYLKLLNTQINVCTHQIIKLEMSRSTNNILSNYFDFISHKNFCNNKFHFISWNLIK